MIRVGGNGTSQRKEGDLGSVEDTIEKNWWGARFGCLCDRLPGCVEMELCVF